MKIGFVLTIAGISFLPLIIVAEVKIMQSFRENDPDVPQEQETVSEN